MTATTLPLMHWAEQQRVAMAQVQANAGPCFTARALRYVPEYLRKHGEASGEEISAACVEAGIKPHDLRAFGPVMKTLLKDQLIQRVGFCIRKRGHGTSGGSVYRLKA